MSTPNDLLEYPVVENFSPEVPIEIFGIANNTKKLVAIVDTGFTGFLQIPLTVGIESNLSLWSVGSSRLADGSMVKNLQCIGRIRFAGKELFGIVTLSEKGNDCLLGMQFLEILKMDFTVSPTRNRAIFKSLESEVLPIPPVSQSVKNEKKKTKTKRPIV